MVGPQHGTEGTYRKQLAQSRTWFVALWVRTRKNETTEHLGMDSDPDHRRMQSPSTRFPHHIYSYDHHSVEKGIDTNARERLGLVVYVQRDRELNAQSKDEPRGLQLLHQLSHEVFLATHKTDCPQHV